MFYDMYKLQAYNVRFLNHFILSLLFNTLQSTVCFMTEIKILEIS